MPIEMTSRNIRLCLFIVAGIFAVSACASFRSIERGEEFLTKKGFYRISTLPGWVLVNDWGVDAMDTSALVTDVQYARCPQTQIISVGRGDCWRSTSHLTGWQSDEGLVFRAQKFIHELYIRSQKLGDSSEPTYEQRIIKGFPAVQITFRMQARKGKYCDGTKPLHELTERFILIDSETRRLGMSGQGGRLSQVFLVFRYETPSEFFKDGLPDFERLVNSVEYIQPKPN